MMTASEHAILYRQRAHALSPDVEFALEDGRLSWVDNKGGSGSLNLSTITALNITYDPSRLITPRWIVDLHASGEKEIRFTSTTLVGAGGFRTRNTAFLAFLAALHQVITAKAPKAECRIGSGTVLFALRLLFWWLPVLGMAWATMLGFTTSVASAGVFFGFLVLYAGQFAARFTYYNWPQRYDPANPPLHLLPKPSERDV